MQISIDIKGLPELVTKLDETVPDLVRRITFGVEGRAKVLIQTSPALGRTYRRQAIKKKGAVVGYMFHRASAPGDPPATDTGFLVNSIQAELNGPGDIGTIEVGALYGAFLEVGTGDMAARPFMVPAIDHVIENL